MVENRKMSIAKISKFFNKVWADQFLLQNQKFGAYQASWITDPDTKNFYCDTRFTGNGLTYSEKNSLSDGVGCCAQKQRGCNFTTPAYVLRHWLMHRLQADMKLQLNFALESNVLWPKQMIGGDPRQLKYKLQVREIHIEIA